MSPTNITGDNLSIVIDDAGLRRLEELVPGRVDAAIGRLALEAANRAQQNIRTVGAVDTGFMVNTTAARRLKPLLWSVGTAAHYGVFIEYGTRYVSPRPWLGPAMATSRRILRALLSNALKGIGR